MLLHEQLGVPKFLFHKNHILNSLLTRLLGSTIVTSMKLLISLCWAVNLFLFNGVACATGVSQPCSVLSQWIGQSRLSANHDLILIPKNPEESHGISVGERYQDIHFRVSSESIEPVAHLFRALGLAVHDTQNILRQLLGNRDSIETSLIPFLPIEVQRSLGQDELGAHCHKAVYYFHGSKQDIPTYKHETYMQYHFMPLAGFVPHFTQARLKLGDTFTFHAIIGEKPDRQIRPIHVGVYLGGDLVYHKFGPGISQYEFRAIESIAAYYDQMQNLAESVPGSSNPNVQLFKHPRMLTFMRPSWLVDQ